MATNKHAQIRYTILDKCFSNFSREYTYDDLLNEVNAVLYERGTEGIKLRQLQYDIAYMKSEDGFNIELDEDFKGQYKRYFRYRDRSFSLADHPLNQDDSEQLQSTLAILTRYKHREEFNWLEELIPRMEQSFDLVSQGEDGLISYQENIDLKGREHIGVLFSEIVKKKVLEIEYEAYNREPESIHIHPYHLKQYNNRWFLFCYNEKYNSMSNYPLDRINKINETDRHFEGVDINWTDYFDTIVGVTKPENSELQLIKLKFSSNRINYVLTKPLHLTQKVDRDDTSGLTIKIEVVPNLELYQLILSFGKDVEVISPENVRDEIKKIISKMNDKY